jgi:hypothetical protein
VAEDWRLTINVRNEKHTGQLLTALNGHEIEDEARERLGKRIAVSGGDNHVFLYADTESAARESEQVVGKVLAAHEMTGKFKLDRWHHEEERWENASVPLPSTPEEKRVEHERLEREETSESQATGLASWEVRIELASHHDARALAEQLEHEGFEQVVRRWRFLLIGTSDEDDAHALAERLQGELPPGATIHAEPGGGMAWELMPGNPFAVMGGLGG